MNQLRFLEIATNRYDNSGSYYIEVSPPDANSTFEYSYFAVYRGQVKFSPTQRAFMDKRDTSDDTAFLVDAQLLVPLANDPNIAGHALDNLLTPVNNLYRFHSHHAEKWVGGQDVVNLTPYIYCADTRVHEVLGTQGDADWVRYEEDPIIIKRYIDHFSYNHNYDNEYAFSLQVITNHLAKVLQENVFRDRIANGTPFFLERDEVEAVKEVDKANVRRPFNALPLTYVYSGTELVQVFYHTDREHVDPSSQIQAKPLIAPLSHGTVTLNASTRLFEFDGITPEEYETIRFQYNVYEAEYKKAYVNNNFIETHVPHDTDRNQVNISAVLALGASKIYYLDEQQVEDYIRNSAPLVDAKFSKKINFNKVFKKNDTVEQWVSTWNALVVSTLAGGTDALKDTNLESLDEVRDFLERLKTNNTNYSNPNNSDDFSGDDWDYIGEVDTRGTHELGSINGNLLFNHIVKSVLFWLYRKTGESKRFYPYWFDGLDVEFNDNVGEYRKKITFRCTQYENEISNISTDEFKALRLVRGERADDPYQNTSEVVETAIKGNAIYFSFTEDDTIRPVEHTTYFTPYNDASYREFTFISYDSEEYVLSNTYTLPRVKESDVYKLLYSDNFKHSVFPDVFTLSVIATGVERSTTYGVDDGAVLHTGVKRGGVLYHYLSYGWYNLILLSYRDILGEVRSYNRSTNKGYWVDKLGFVHASGKASRTHHIEDVSYILNTSKNSRMYNLFQRRHVSYYEGVVTYLDVHILGEVGSLYVDKVVLHLPEGYDSTATIVDGVLYQQPPSETRTGKVARNTAYIPTDAQVVCDGATLTISNLQGRIPIDYVASIVPTMYVNGKYLSYVTDPYLPNIRYIYPESTYTAREKFYPIPVSDKEVKLLTPVEASGWLFTFHKKPTDSTPVDIDEVVLELYKEYVTKQGYTLGKRMWDYMLSTFNSETLYNFLSPKENIGLTSAIHNSYVFKALKELGIAKVFPFIFDYIEFTYEGEYQDLVLKGLFRNTYHEGTDLTLEDLDYQITAIDTIRYFSLLRGSYDTPNTHVQVTPVTTVTNGVIEVQFELPLGRQLPFMSRATSPLWQQLNFSALIAGIHIYHKTTSTSVYQLHKAGNYGLFEGSRRAYRTTQGWVEYLQNTPELNPFELFSKWYKQDYVINDATSPVVVVTSQGIAVPTMSDFLLRIDGKIHAIYAGRWGITQVDNEVGKGGIVTLLPTNTDISGLRQDIRSYTGNSLTPFVHIQLTSIPEGKNVTVETYDANTKEFKTVYNDKEFSFRDIQARLYSKVYLRDVTSGDNSNLAVDVYHHEVTYTYRGNTSGKRVKLKPLAPYSDVPEGSYLYSDHVSNGKWTKWVESADGREVTATFATNPELHIQSKIHFNYPAMVWEIADISTGKVVYEIAEEQSPYLHYIQETFYDISTEREQYVREQLLPAIERRYAGSMQIGDWTLSHLTPKLLTDLGWRVEVTQLALNTGGMVNAELYNFEGDGYGVPSALDITDILISFINDIESGTATVAESLDELDVTQYSLANHPEVPLVAVRYENELYLAVPADRYYGLLSYIEPFQHDSEGYLTLSDTVVKMTHANGYNIRFTIGKYVEDMPSAEDDNPTIQPPQGDDTMDTQPNDQNNAQCVCVCETTLKAQREQQEKERKMAETKQKGNDLLSLVRVNVTCLDPMKRNYEGEVITVSNDVIGSIKKYVAYGTTNGWHLPKIIVNELKQKKVQIFSKQKNSKGDDTITPKLINAYSVEELPPLSPEELKELAKVQLAQGL